MWNCTHFRHPTDERLLHRYIPPIFDGRHWSAEYRSTYRPTNRARLGRFMLSLLVQRSIDAQSSNQWRTAQHLGRQEASFVIFPQGLFAFNFSYLTWKVLIPKLLFFYSFLFFRPIYRPLSSPIYRLMYRAITVNILGEVEVSVNSLIKNDSWFAQWYSREEVVIYCYPMLLYLSYYYSTLFWSPTCVKSCTCVYNLIS